MTEIPDSVQLPDGRVLHTPTNTTARIETLWAYLSVDEGGEGICAREGADGRIYPLITNDPSRLYLMATVAREIADVSGRKIRLAKFTTREDLGEF